MKYFKKIIKNMEETASYIGKKAKDSVDITKLNKELIKENKNLKLLYQELGRISYEIHTGDTSDIDTIKKLCNQIREKINKIDKLKEKINNIKYPSESIKENKKTEIKQGYINKNIPKPEVGADGLLLLKFCPKCQTGNNPDADQCISCGHILKNK
ncbi:zinc ribbon domain-containing protein [Defluviitalea phaphyphila]|uniref:zinc ribbon domain-containing protein n=1 Tax=Defluviitalea phaphyphila TaxID=1473580 RepID=UPI0007304214|nr:zinc ribbon domain-containing protein [Defluviitalea phaphyphila]